MSLQVENQGGARDARVLHSYFVRMSSDRQHICFAQASSENKKVLRSEIRVQAIPTAGSSPPFL